MDVFVTMLKIIGSILHLLIKIALLPIQIILSVLIFMIDFAGNVVGFLSGIVGGIIILGGISSLFFPPVDWKLFVLAMVMGSIIGALPRIVCYYGDSALAGIKYILAKI